MHAASSSAQGPDGAREELSAPVMADDGFAELFAARFASEDANNARLDLESARAEAARFALELSQRGPDAGRATLATGLDLENAHSDHAASSSAQELAHGISFADARADHAASSSAQELAHGISFADARADHAASSFAQELAHGISFEDARADHAASSSAQELAHGIAFADARADHAASSSAQELAHGISFEDARADHAASLSAQELAHGISFEDARARADHAAAQKHEYAHYEELSSKQAKLDGAHAEIAHAYEVEEQKMKVETLQEQLSATQLDAAALAARFLQQGGVEAATSHPKRQQLLADAGKSKHLAVTDEVGARTEPLPDPLSPF